MNAKHNQELKDTLERLNQKNIEIDSLGQQMEAARVQDEAEENLKNLQNSSGGALGPVSESG
ncbi:MAG: hypothetical protein ACLUD2_19680 [Clostridium sp.]